MPNNQPARIREIRKLHYPKSSRISVTVVSGDIRTNRVYVKDTSGEISVRPPDGSIPAVGTDMEYEGFLTHDELFVAFRSRRLREPEPVSEVPEGVDLPEPTVSPDTGEPIPYGTSPATLRNLMERNRITMLSTPWHEGSIRGLGTRQIREEAPARCAHTLLNHDVLTREYVCSQCQRRFQTSADAVRDAELSEGRMARLQQTCTHETATQNISRDWVCTNCQRVFATQGDLRMERANRLEVASWRERERIERERAMDEVSVVPTPSVELQARNRCPPGNCAICDSARSRDNSP
jgi:hypothetical protein